MANPTDPAAPTAPMASAGVSTGPVMLPGDTGPVRMHYVDEGQCALAGTL